MTYPTRDVDLETPEADAAEQAVDAIPVRPENEDLGVRPFSEASEWDAQEQSRIVEFEDDYR